MSKIELAPIDHHASQAYLAYAMSIVKSRALPDVEDGLKPVQRRILYAMRRLRLHPTSKPMKSARVVGDVLGQFHPHGDGATYEAMVHMAQDFSLRYPLVHGEGNYGSRDGDPAAAYRYTEAKLSIIAQALLDELDLETVDFKPNFDGKEVEPETLPSRLPFLLINGAFGIGVGWATSFPSNNLREIAEAAKILIKHPKTSEDEVLSHIPGPDFPCGAALISSQEDIVKAYKEGKGSLRLRARWFVEEEVGKSQWKSLSEGALPKGKWRLVFHEIPQPSKIEPIMIEISELLDPPAKEIKGKKQPLKPEQLRIKRLFNELIDHYENGSDREAPVRLVVYPKDKKMDPQALALTLCAHTTLECNVSVNLVAVDRTGTPRLGSFVDWLSQWCEYRVETVRRRLTYEKKKVDHRLHIVAGRLSILDKIQEVVKVLTQSEEPKADLMKKFGLDDIQAEDILDLKMRSIARLEKIKLQEERDLELLPEQARLAKLLADDKLMRKLVITELEQDVKKYGDDRRTLIQPATSSAATKKQINESVLAEKLAPEPVGIALTERGWIAWRPAKSLEEAQGLDYKIKAGDQIKQIFFGDRQDHLLVMDEKGRAYSLRLTDLPSRADTAPLTTWFDLSGKVASAQLAARPDQMFMIASDVGYGFVVRAQDWINRMKAGKGMLSLQDSEKPLSILPLPEHWEETCLTVLAEDGRQVVFPLKGMSVLGKGKGLALMGGGGKIIDMALVSAKEDILLQTKKGVVKVKHDDWQSVLGPRSSSKKGRVLHKQAPGSMLLRSDRCGPIESPPSA